MLSEFLHYQKLEGLQAYVVATCHRKIRGRLVDKLSRPYLDLLHDTVFSSNPPPFVTIPLELEKSKQLENDKTFFIKILPKILPYLATKVPLLQEAISKAASNQSITACYNEDTYMEYHMLLWDLLDSFKMSLDHLNNIKDPHAKNFDAYMNCVMVLGNALQSMSRGHVVEMHMKVILSNNSSFVRTMHNVNRDTELDEEIYWIGSAHPPWRAFCEWLKLMLVHFDAVNILTAHVKSHQISEVTIKVISVPYPDENLLEWRKLLKNKRYFDASVGPFGTRPSTDEIIAFLEMWQLPRKEKGDDGGDPDPGIDSIIKDFKDFCAGTTTVPLDELIEDIKLMKCRSPGYEVVVDNLTETLTSLKCDGGRPSSATGKVILNDLESLRDRALFFLKLRNLSFNGSMHCELIIACFMMLESSSELFEEYKGIVNEISVSCIVSTL